MLLSPPGNFLSDVCRVSTRVLAMTEKPQQDKMNERDLHHLKASLEQLHRFKALLFELSAKFVSLSLDEIDKEIENGLELIAQFLEIDRAHLLEVNEDGPEAYITHAYALEGIPTYVGLKGSPQFPWAFQKIRRGEVVRFSCAEEEIKEADERSGVCYQRRH